MGVDRTIPAESKDAWGDPLPVPEPTIAEIAAGRAVPPDDVARRLAATLERLMHGTSDRKA